MIEMCQTPLFGFHFSGARYAKNICTFRKSGGKRKTQVGMAEIFSAHPSKKVESSPI
jgi:hypothetical protein